MSASLFRRPPASARRCTFGPPFTANSARTVAVLLFGIGGRTLIFLCFAFSYMYANIFLLGIYKKKLIIASHPVFTLFSLMPSLPFLLFFLQLLVLKHPYDFRGLPLLFVLFSVLVLIQL